VTDVTTKSPSETGRLGRRIGRAITSPIAVLLSGEMGVGKTALAKGIARGLGVKDEVISSSFLTMRAYAGRLPFVHVDLYKLEARADLYELGLADLPEDAVVVVEWAQRFPLCSGLPALGIDIQFCERDNERRMKIDADRLGDDLRRKLERALSSRA
jgi:tRNA threonylcarbamoyladenosine biosynthesis protein TsaE